MINAIIRTALGPWGSAVLDFYINNSLWINSLLLLYALLVALGRRNYRLFIDSLLADFRAAQAEKITEKDRSQLLHFLKKAKLPWDQALKTAWFPLFTPPGKLWFFIKNTGNLQKQFSHEKLLDILLK